MQSMGECDQGNPPFLFEFNQCLHMHCWRWFGENPLLGNEKGQRESIRLSFSHLTLNFYFLMQNKMPQLVHHIQTNPLGAFKGIEKQKGRFIDPNRAGIDFAAVLGQRKDAHAFGFQKRNSVVNGLDAEAPQLAKSFCRIFGSLS